MVPVPAAGCLDAQEHQDHRQQKAENSAEKGQAQRGPKAGEKQGFAVEEHIHHGLKKGRGVAVHPGDLPHHLA